MVLILMIRIPPKIAVDDVFIPRVGIKDSSKCKVEEVVLLDSTLIFHFSLYTVFKFFQTAMTPDCRPGRALIHGKL